LLERRTSNYDKFPVIAIDAPPDSAWSGWQAIAERIGSELSRGATRIAIECYPGVFEEAMVFALKSALGRAFVARTSAIWKDSTELNRLVARDLTDDPVFGRMNGFGIEDFADPTRLEACRVEIQEHGDVPIVVAGTGTSLLMPDPQVVIYADLPRWEIQKRQRSGQIGNLGADNHSASASAKYKRGYFLDWRVADRIKRELLGRLDYLLDTTDSSNPILLTGNLFRNALQHTSSRPFRVVPFFDPGPWGGQWMRNICGLDSKTPNYAWCFDCVPEENSLLFDFGRGARSEVPALDLVLLHPRELLGEAVHGRFGAEFPIRFDLLDTMQGGNLSLQVHPLTEYIYDKFGMAYTQDESYYMLDAAPDASVYLGLRPGIDRCEMARDLEQAQAGVAAFDAGRFVNRWPARKHDHFLIPAGTIHCSGANGVVLEISATPYIFTFKLWDWGRLGLDGKPRPIHLGHGLNNIQWDRDTEWVKSALINKTRVVAQGENWTEEHTGLHAREFIETRRHWFSGRVSHDTEGGVHVLNLVEGDAAIVESPGDQFAPFEVHYAETFIVPAAVGRYSVRPRSTGARCGTIRASVRT
jgi:mannose-6-phosphate isomerase class I